MQFFCIKCNTETAPLQNLNNKEFELTVNYPNDVDIQEIFLTLLMIIVMTLLSIHLLHFHIDALKLHNLQFDFICITETKIIKNIEPLVDITIDGYQYPVWTPTEATKGGVLIYVKEGIEFKPREDLNIYKPKELESYFLETIDLINGLYI